MKNRARRTFSISVGVALLCVLVAPVAAEACVATYLDYDVDIGNQKIEAWAWAEDYYSSGSCYSQVFPYWGYWEHTYEASVDIYSPTSSWAADGDSEYNIPYGGDSVSAYTYLSTASDPGVYSLSLTVTIVCTVGGTIASQSDNPQEPVETPLHEYDEWPTDSCSVNQDYSPSHRGKDMDATDYGTDVDSMDGGTVTAIESGGSPGGTENFVVVQGSDGQYSIYAHVTPSVSVNDTVSAGDKIGEVDNTGQTSGPHAHICRSSTQSCAQGVDYELPSCA